MQSVLEKSSGCTQWEAGQRRLPSPSLWQGPYLSLPTKGATGPGSEASVRGEENAWQGFLPPTLGAQAPAPTCSFN